MNPLCLFLTPDMMFSTRILSAAAATGVSVKIAPNTAKLLDAVTADTRLILIDLVAPGVEILSIVAAVHEKAPAARIVAFGPHVDEQLLQAAQQAGCHAVLTRGQFNQTYPQLLAELK